MRLRVAAGAAALWVAAFAFGQAWAGTDSVSTPLYDELANFNTSLRDRTGVERSAAVVSRYRDRTAGQDLCAPASVRPDRADDLFRATAFAELYSLDAADVTRLGCLYRDLDAMGGITDWHRKTYAGALVSVARYADATALLGADARLPAIESDARGSATGRYITLESTEHATVAAWKPAASDLQVVAVVHPACAFSVRALTQIDSDPSLAWLKSQLLLVVPPGATLPVNGLLNWNNHHPGVPMHVMYQRTDWTQLASLDTPTFYLMRGDRVVFSFEGWPNGEGLKSLHAALQAATAPAPSPAPAKS